ncbi:C2 domain-containing protein 5-like isoform X3 [Zophobas morio]|uniref:C2 domain-containing protein 5-like isoform X3 n=1 Tax=Zophobas morio TaxID=2755281 RepID=UPI003082A7B1
MPLLSVCRKTLCPTWNTDFRFEVDAEIQNDILEIKIYDHDSYSANDAIGKVYIDLSPLTMTNGPTLLQGWHPIYDTLRGIRGEINLIVKLHFFNNENKFRDTSIGVKIFALNEFPSCYSLIKVHSFVEELVVSTDPEYQWVDNFRSNRASNDARVRLLYRLTGSLKRKLGLKALDLGGNAIVGYLQDFDIEGEYGLVARGIGTVVTLQEFEPAMASQGPALLLFQDPARAQCKGSLNRSGQGDLSVHRFYSHHLKSVFPFYTLSHWPSSVIQSIGGFVTARSVKLLSKIEEPDEPETRDAWWHEIRSEIDSHAKVLGCSVVIGYTETTTICDELCILSATGTAANLAFTSAKDEPYKQSPTFYGKDKIASLSKTVSNKKVEYKLCNLLGVANNSAETVCPAGFSHVPFTKKDSPFTNKPQKCRSCQKFYVPDILICTLELQPGSQLGSLLIESLCVEASVCRAKKKLQGESNAIVVSEVLPFIEYELHRQLLNKLKLHAMNAIFGLSVQISISESVISALAVGTAVFIKSLPLLPPIKISRSLQVLDEEDQKLVSIQKKIIEKSGEQRRARMESVAWNSDSDDADSKTDSSDENISENIALELAKRRSLALEIDDEEDEDNLAILMEPPPLFGPSVQFSTLQAVPPGTEHLSFINAQMITSLHQATLDESFRINQSFSGLFKEIKQSLRFKLRHFSPCCVLDLKFDVTMSEEEKNIAQILTSAMVVPSKSKQFSEKSDDLLFGSEEAKSQASRDSLKEKTVFVEMTTLNYVVGRRVVRYLSHIELFLIKENALRETDSVSEFIHVFVTEVYAIARAQVRLLCGNAILALKLRIIDCNAGEGYVLVMLSGDVCVIS